MKSYSSLNDPVTHDANAFAAGSVVAKFCSMGLVSSQKWFPCYISIIDGVLRLYDDEASSKMLPQYAVLQIPLSSHHQTSPIKKKAYTQNNANQAIELNCFYVQIDNGAFFPTRQLKVGCVDRAVAERLIRAIQVNVRHY